MGDFLDPDNEEYLQLTRADYFVDKTGLLSLTNRKINGDKRPLFLSKCQDVLLVGVSYDPETQEHTCIIEHHHLGEP